MGAGGGGWGVREGKIVVLGRKEDFFNLLRSYENKPLFDVL